MISASARWWVPSLVAASQTGSDFPDDLLSTPGYERLAYLMPT